MTQNAISPARRVLFVDDDVAARTSLKATLQKWSYAPSMATSFYEARNVVLTEEPFAVVVSDYHLPDGTGLELLDWLRREMLIPVPFLLISGGLIRAPDAAEQYEFLAKPFELPVLRDRLDALSQVQPWELPSHLSAAQEAMASVYARSKRSQDR